MIYNEYGNTGKKVSAIGMGGMRFENPDDVDACATLVKTAHEKGINYFDTAIGYGKSESLYGVAFKDMLKIRAQKPFYVATKTMKKTPAEVRQELETSLERMGLDYVDFYHVWSVMSLDDFRSREKNGVIREFEKFKAEGLVKHICVSTHMTGEEIEIMLEEYPFEGALLGYSAMNFAYRDRALEAAARLNRGIVVMNPLGGGVIPQNPERFKFLKTKEEETVVEAALRFLMADSRITVSLVGLSNLKQLDEAISAAEGFEHVPGNIERIRRGLSENLNELCTNCRYCDSCPLEIPVPKMMDAYNQFILTGDIKNAVNRLPWHWGINLNDEIISKCVECGLCESKCTQKLPICKRLSELQQAVEDMLAKTTGK
jgi:predicted aldo/keto reductase-like oxidoreductase